MEELTYLNVRGHEILYDVVSIYEQLFCVEMLILQEEDYE